MKNKKISSSINQWHVEKDLCGFTEDLLWLNNVVNEGVVLNLTHVYGDGPIIELSFNNMYHIKVSYNDETNDTFEVFDSYNIDFISNKVYELMDKYAGG